MAFIANIRLCLLALWLGAALYFTAVVAPAVFSVLRAFDLPNVGEIAGSIVNRSLSVVNIGGFIVGLFLLLTVFVVKSRYSVRSFMLQLLSLATLTSTTGIGHWLIAVRMRALRTAMALPIDQLSPDDPRRVAFNSLHRYSVTALGIAMIAGLIALLAAARWTGNNKRKR